MKLITQLTMDVAQNPKTVLGVIGITTSSGILTILEKGLGWLAVILPVVLTIVVIYIHYLKMKILKNDLIESEARKKARLK